MAISRRSTALAVAACFLAAAATGAGAARPQDTSGQSYPKKPPGPLSQAHAESPGANCRECHSAEWKALPQNCLVCHKEIARQAGAPKGYHRDKGEGCADCHAEHQGPGKSIVPLDVKDFDHSETGTVFRGAHLKVGDCGRCHRPEISFARTKAKSYILKDDNCRACHHSPHPGAQDNCLACHNQDSWSIDREKGGI